MSQLSASNQLFTYKQEPFHQACHFILENYLKSLSPVPAFKRVVLGWGYTLVVGHVGLNTEEAVGSNLGTVNNQKKKGVLFEGRNTRDSKSGHRELYLKLPTVSSLGMVARAVAPTTLSLSHWTWWQGQWLPPPFQEHSCPLHSQSYGQLCGNNAENVCWEEFCRNYPGKDLGA